MTVEGLEGETLAEGQLRTTQEDVGEFFQAMTAARVVIEVGTHSAWVQEIVGMLLAIGAAVVAIKFERPPIYGVTALLLGLFSYVVFVG